MAVDGFVPIVPSEAVVIGLGALSTTGRPNYGRTDTVCLHRSRTVPGS